MAVLPIADEQASLLYTFYPRLIVSPCGCCANVRGLEQSTASVFEMDTVAHCVSWSPEVMFTAWC
jgi:hypothetical protein